MIINLRLNNPLYDEGFRDLLLVKYGIYITPSYREVIDFLLWDRTDFMKYIPGSFICNDFNALVHNRAQYFYYPCYFVLLHDLDKECGHTCVAWDTTDYGRIYTDSTGVYDPDYSYLSYDKIIENVRIGEQPEAIDIESRFKSKFPFLIGDMELL